MQRFWSVIRNWVLHLNSVSFVRHLVYETMLMCELSWAIKLLPRNKCQWFSHYVYVVSNYIYIYSVDHFVLSSAHLRGWKKLVQNGPRFGTLILCSHYLASALCPNHPSFPIVFQPTNQAPKKHTLKSRFLPSVGPYLRNGTINLTEYEDIRNDLHHQTVQSAIQWKAKRYLTRKTPSSTSCIKKSFYEHTEQPFLK